MLGSGTQAALLTSPDQTRPAKETKLPISRASKRLGKKGGDEVNPPKEMHAKIPLTSGGIISIGKKKLMKNPPFPDPRGIWL